MSILITIAIYFSQNHSFFLCVCICVYTNVCTHTYYTLMYTYIHTHTYILDAIHRWGYFRLFFFFFQSVNELSLPCLLLFHVTGGSSQAFSPKGHGDSFCNACNDNALIFQCEKLDGF